MGCAGHAPHGRRWSKGGCREQLREQNIGEVLISSEITTSGLNEPPPYPTQICFSHCATVVEI